MNIASIDIGTNTVLLLIAEVSRDDISKVLYNAIEFPRLGKGLNINGEILNESIESLLTILGNYITKIKEYKCAQVFAVGTHALRVAKNSNLILKKIKEKFGIDVQVISPIEEAEYSYFGSVEFNTNINYCVIDIGGGSSEISIGTSKNMVFNKSFPIGAVSSTEKYLLNSPPSKLEIQNLQSHVKKVFKELFKFRKLQPVTYSIAGTPTTLVCMKKGLKQFYEEQIDNTKLTKKEILDQINILQEFNKEEILNNYGSVMYGRNDIILAGSILLFNIINLMNLKEVIVSTKGLRYGVIKKQLLYSQNSRNYFY